MKKKIVYVVVLLTALLFVSGCGMNLSLSSVEILSVETTPDDSLLYDGELYDFEVEVSYFNATLKTLDLNVALNNWDDAGSYVHLDSIEVDPFESGTYIFDFYDSAKDWGSEGDFGVLVNLITQEPPLIGDWRSEAVDIEDLATTGSY